MHEKTGLMEGGNVKSINAITNESLTWFLGWSLRNKKKMDDEHHGDEDFMVVPYAPSHLVW